MKKNIKKILENALTKLPKFDASIENISIDQSVERTKNPNHGDFTTNIAMQIASSSGKNPKEIAENIISEMIDIKGIHEIKIAGPGFINFYLDEKSFHDEIATIIDRNDSYAIKTEKQKTKILLEFVSANPTGPLHVGHGRHAAYGATVGNLLEAIGYEVTREYYVNDAGRQMNILCVSVILRLLEINGKKIQMPAASYKGEYISEIAGLLLKSKIPSVKSEALFESLPEDEPKGDKDKYIDALIENAIKNIGKKIFNSILEQTVELIRDDIKNDLEEFGVIYDSWFFEKNLEKKGDLDKTLSIIKKNKMLYKKDGAIWFKSSDFGDEKDRVVTRENGINTYFASDIAYHYTKRKRGYGLLINILGSDHHGYITRVQASLQAMGYRKGSLEVELVQFVSLFRDGKKQSMSTRSGDFISLRKLRQEVGNDAARFFYILYSHEQHLDFDLELAKKRSNENPVYYIQYAHARIASVFKQISEQEMKINTEVGFDNLSKLNKKQEKSLMSLLSRYPEVIELAAKKRAPHLLAHYLKDLANEFHSYYNAHTFIVTDNKLRNARLVLIKATQIVIANGLKILGVSAPLMM